MWILETKTEKKAGGAGLREGNVEFICGYAEGEAPARYRRGCMLGSFIYGSEVPDM